MRSRALKNFHLPLPEELYDELRREAEREQVPATTLAREALEHWLREKRRQDLRRAIEGYAVEVAGTGEDFDEALEAASVEHLLEEPTR
jgi:predicted DNA-binding protein